ncbi:hypothetical protein QBC46DRAFT_227893, partial [Diplogelasinospora grovesii]
CVAKVRFDGGGESCYALKVREARTVAVLEKVQAGLHAAGSSSPAPAVHIPAERTTRLDCLRCLYAFSAEGRRDRPFDDYLPPEQQQQRVSSSGSFTRIRKCFGWTRVQGADFVAMNMVIKIDSRAAMKGEGSASYIRAGQDYFALVYEYIPSAELEVVAVQRQLDFFHHIGFQPCQQMNREN